MTDDLDEIRGLIRTKIADHEKAVHDLEASAQEHRAAVQQLQQALDSLSGVSPPDPGQATAVRAAENLGYKVTVIPPRTALSVRAKMQSLLDEGDQDWSAQEIVDEWDARGDPIKGNPPAKAVRTALATALKAGEIFQTDRGRYRSARYLPDPKVLFPTGTDSDPLGRPFGPSFGLTRPLAARPETLMKP